MHPVNFFDVCQKSIDEITEKAMLADKPKQASSLNLRYVFFRK